MPLDDTGGTPQPAPAVKSLDLGSTALGQAIGGMIPQARAEQRMQDAARTEVRGQLEKITDRSEKRREALGPPKEVPTPPPAPEMHHTDPVSAWGSLAMGLAMIASGFTKQPLTTALNAGAGVLKAFKQGDMDAYKTAFDHWKAVNDYTFKMYEFQHEAYRDAIADIDRDEKGAIAKLSAWMATFKDPWKSVLDAGNTQEVLRNLESEPQKVAKLKAETDKAVAQGEAVVSVSNADKAFQASPTPENKAALDAAVAHAARIRQADTAGPQPHLTVPHEFEIRDKDGNVVRAFMGQESTTTAGLPIDSQSGQPVTLGEGQSVHLAPPPSQGRQAAMQTQALSGAASEVTRSLQNLTRLPISANLGPFMGLQSEHPDSLSGAIRNVAATKLTPESSIALTQMFAGVKRSLGILEGQGRATGLVGLSESNQVLVPQPGWSGLDVLRSYAEIAQITEANIRVMLAAPQTSPEQKQLLRQINKEFREAVPYTVNDINDVAFGLRGKRRQQDQTVRDFADKVIKTRELAKEQPAADDKPAAPPKVTNQAEYDKLPLGADYIGPDGTPHKKGGAPAPANP